MAQEKNVWFQRREISDDCNRNVESYLVLLELNNDDNLLLGASELGGSIWSGSLWLFQRPDDAPSAKKSVAGVELDVGASVAKFLPKGSQVVAADFSGDLSLYSIKQAAENCPVYFTRVAGFPGHESYVTSLDVTSNENFVSGSCDNSLIIWEVETQYIKARYISAHTDIISGLSIQPDQDDIFASSSFDSLSLLWDPRCNKPASKLSQSNVSFTCLDWLDPTTVILGDEAGSVQVVDIRSRTPLETLALSDRHPVKRLRANRASKVVAFAVDKPSVEVMQWKDGKLCSVVSYLTKDMVRGLAWSSKTGLLHSCGWDTQVLSKSVPTL